MKVTTLLKRLREPVKHFCLLLTAFSLIASMPGCESAWNTRSPLDPTEMGRDLWKKSSFDPLLLPILSSLSSGYDEPNNQFTTATDVRPDDLKVNATDYVIGRNDLLQINLTEVTPGVETVKTARVTESGYITVPLIGQIQADGLTENQLDDAIKKKYADSGIIKNAQVSVTVVEARQRTFQIRGAVARPGQYAIVQADFKLLDALILAGDVTQQQIPYLYVIRPAPKVAATQSTTMPAEVPLTPAVAPMTGPDVLEPKVPSTPPASMPAAVTPPTSAPAPTTNAMGLLDDGTKTDEAGKVFINGSTSWAAAATTNPTTAPAESQATNSKPFEFNAPLPPDDSRIIRVPLQQLLDGDLRYNIVVRAWDTIVIPIPESGEFYVGGHVQRVGVYSLTARKITVKEAIISAGMLDPLAIPSHTDVIRRIGNDREIFVHIDIADIFEGSQPDIFLKPYDIIMVGTNAPASFWAAIRNSFRFTYGFGFLYDRNFS